MSQERVASSCKHTKRSNTEDMIVCISCGTVLEDDSLVDNTINEAEDRRKLWTELTGSQIVSLTDESHRKSRILHEMILAIQSRFSLPKKISLQAIELIDQAVQKNLVNRGRMGRRAVAVLMYLLCRSEESPIPLTLRKVADLCGERADELFCLFPILQPLVLPLVGALSKNTPAQHLERLLNQLDFDKAVLSEILPLATELVYFSEDWSLIEGRRVEAIALACIIIAAEAIGKAPTKPRLQREFVERCCAATEIRITTVTQRIDEMKTALLKEAQDNPLLTESVGCKFKKASISILAADILKYRRLGPRPAPSTPIAFANSQARTAARMEQIRRALGRIADPQHVQEEELRELTIDDLIIERLLLHRVSEDCIAEASNTGHLCSLEEKLFLDRAQDDADDLDGSL